MSNFIDLPIPHPFPIPTGPSGDACSNANCVDAETLPTGEVEFWSTRYPERGRLRYDADEVAKFLAEVKAGKWDHLAVDAPVTTA